MIAIEWNPPVRHLKQFAAIWFPAFAAALGGIFWYRWGLQNAAWTIWGIACILSIIGFFVPAFMRWVWIAVMLVTFPIGWVVSHLLMAMIFYLVFTPCGWIMRAVGYDPMQRRFDKHATTYWQERKQPEDTTGYFRQF